MLDWKKILIRNLFLLSLFLIPVPISAQVPDGTEAAPGCVGVNRGDVFTFNVKEIDTLTNGSSILVGDYNETLTVVDTPYTTGGDRIWINVTSTRPDSRLYQTNVILRSATEEFVWVNNWNDYRTHFKNLTLEEVKRNNSSTVWQVGETADIFTVTEIDWGYLTNTASSGNMTGFTSSNYNKTNGVLSYQTIEFFAYGDLLYSKLTIKKLISAEQQDQRAYCQLFPTNSFSSQSDVIFPQGGIIAVVVIPFTIKRNQKNMNQTWIRDYI